jgi:hypothetical protein
MKDTEMESLQLDDAPIAGLQDDCAEDMPFDPETRGSAGGPESAALAQFAPRKHEPQSKALVQAVRDTLKNEVYTHAHTHVHTNTIVHTYTRLCVDKRHDLVSNQQHPGLLLQYSGWVTDACIDRYLRAEKGSCGSAAKRVAATMKWRQETSPAEIACTACADDHRNHDARFIGLDRHRRPCIYRLHSLYTCM